MYTVGQISKRFGLSRSALLYYDSVGLLPPASRSAANYRLYSDEDIQRMEKIQAYRNAGLPLETIAHLLQADAHSAPTLLERHLLEVNQEITRLRKQQQVIVNLLNNEQAFRDCRAMSKERWTALLAATGLDEGGMHKWHVEFEKMSPEAHQDFLESLGIEMEEIAAIRAWSRGE